MAPTQSTQDRLVLNVGGANKNIAIPNHYSGWQHLLLDIDPTVDADILCDARKLDTLDAGIADAVYCSHNLEHYYRHEVPGVLAGFRHVLKQDGFCEIVVPDLDGVMRIVVDKNLDVDDVLYESPSGPILVRDVLYGWGVQVERTGNDFYAHKTGFTVKSLVNVLTQAGFAAVYAGAGRLEVRAIAFLQAPSEFQRQLLGIAPPPGQ